MDICLRCHQPSDVPHCADCDQYMHETGAWVLGQIPGGLLPDDLITDAHGKQAVVLSADVYWHDHLGPMVSVRFPHDTDLQQALVSVTCVERAGVVVYWNDEPLWQRAPEPAPYGDLPLFAGLG